MLTVKKVSWMSSMKYLKSNPSTRYLKYIIVNYRLWTPHTNTSPTLYSVNVLVVPELLLKWWDFERLICASILRALLTLKFDQWLAKILQMGEIRIQFERNMAGSGNARKLVEKIWDHWINWSCNEYFRMLQFWEWKQWKEICEAKIGVENLPQWNCVAHEEKEKPPQECHWVKREYHHGFDSCPFQRGRTMKEPQVL